MFGGVGGESVVRGVLGVVWCGVMCNHVWWLGAWCGVECGLVRGEAQCVVWRVVYWGMRFMVCIVLWNVVRCEV